MGVGLFPYKTDRSPQASMGRTSPGQVCWAAECSDCGILEQPTAHGRGELPPGLSACAYRNTPCPQRVFANNSARWIAGDSGHRKCVLACSSDPMLLT